MNKFILCLGDNTDITDTLAKSLAQDLNINYNGLLLPDTKIVPGLYQSSLYDMSYENILGILPTLTELIVLNVPISSEFVANFIPETVFNKLVSIRNAAQLNTNNNKILRHAIFNNKQKDTFCVLPWVHLYAIPSGKVFPCCVADESFPMGDLSKQSIAEVRDGEKMISIRQEMLSGQVPAACASCFLRESQGYPSARQSHNEQFSSIAKQIKESQTTNAVDVKFADIRFSNVCNLKCRTCTPDLSSKWYTDAKKIFNIQQPKVIDHNIDMEELDFSSLDYVFFAGGEPLITKDHYNFLDKLVKANNLDVNITYISNLSTLSFNNKHILDYWKQFKNIKLIASIDAIDDKLAYIRKGAKWNIIVDNLYKVKDANCANIGVAVTVSILNIFDLIEIYQTLSNLNVFDPKLIFLNKVESTVYNLDILPPEIRQQLIKEIKCFTKTLHDSHIVSEFDKIVSVLEQGRADYKERLAGFFDMTEKLDYLRNENINTTLPDVSNLRRYIT